MALSRFVVALVGRPNVGKSTLFNRLTQTRRALVADFPGLTRDRQIHIAHYQQHPYWLVDTGGLGVDDADVDALMSKQTQQALSEANAVLFLVDARSGLTPLDESIARQLRKLGKPFYVVVNKTEGLDALQACQDFLRLGVKETYPISAAHGRGIDTLLHDLFETQTVETSEPEETQNNDAIQIAFVGRPNVGKSTLVNRMLGEERVVVFDAPGTTRDSIEIPFERNGKSYVLVDTAGLRRRAKIGEKIEKFSVIKTLEAIDSAMVCLMMVDATEGLTDQDLHLLGLVIEAGRALVILVNKWDGLAEEKKNKIKDDIDRRLRFVDFARVRFISALHGTGVGKLYQDIHEAYQASIKKFSTAKLTRLLGEIVQQHAPPLVKGRRIKLRYIHFGGHNPPVLVVHGNQLDKLPESYTRYLSHAFMTHLGLVGTPIQFEFKNSANPYEGKRNTLTPRQMRRKKRMIKHYKSKG